MTSTWQLIIIQKFVLRKFWKLNLWLKGHYVSFKSKLQRLPLAYPGRLIPLLSRRGGDLIIRVFREVRNFDRHAQGMGYLNWTLDLISFWSFWWFPFLLFGFYYRPQGPTSVVFIQQIVKQSTLWKGSCIILKQSEYWRRKHLKKTKASHLIYRFHMNVNRPYSLDKSNSLDWEGAWNRGRRHWT